MNIDHAGGPKCIVLNGDKLPTETGGPAGICAAIRGALADAGGSSRIQVEVNVKSNSWLVAHIVRNGTALPDQNLAISDGKLRKSSVDQFARAIAQAVATAG